MLGALGALGPSRDRGSREGGGGREGRRDVSEGLSMDVMMADR